MAAPTMRVSARKLERLLERRLNEVMPTPFRLRAGDGYLDLYNGYQWALSTSLDGIVEDDTRELTERLDTAVYSVLNSVQDVISVDRRTPWPSINGREMAMPGVRVDAESIHLWFGRDEAAPVLAIPSIAITEISAGD